MSGTESERIKVVFVAAAGRSGSTLLECMLGQLPGVFAAGEVTHIWERGFQENQLCGCGKPFHDCAFWTKVADEAFGDVGDPDFSRIQSLRRSVCTLGKIPQLAVPELRTSRFQSRLRSYSGWLERIYRAIQKVSGCPIILDSSKYPPESFLLRSMDGVDLSVVHLVRNSNAVVYAWQKRKIRPEIHWAEEYMPTYSFFKTALAWNTFNLLIASLKSPNVPYHMIRYEDLVQKPRERMRELCRFLGREPGNLDFVQADSVRLEGNHTVSGNSIRFETGVVPLKLDSEWREKAPRPQRILVNLATFHLQRKYGYLADR